MEKIAMVRVLVSMQPSLALPVLRNWSDNCSTGLYTVHFVVLCMTAWSHQQQRRALVLI